MGSEALAHVGGLWAHDLVEVARDPAAMESGGRWAVVIPYDGTPVFARFARWTPESPRLESRAWSCGETWSTSLDEESYVAGVRRIQEYIAAGDVYQVNLCRVLSTETDGDIAALHEALMGENPAPHQGLVSIPEVDLHVVTASPELFLRRRGSSLFTSPIKGTASSRESLREKDIPENIMIVDLMRNDLARVAITGSVRVPELLRVEQHPGLVHLVSDVTCEISDAITWEQILAATFPPGSVTGAPKSSALRIIDECEPVSREVYCGAIGWIDADRREAELAVAIRTFWIREGVLRFGTGAGITWGSDPGGEWRETELKALRLCAVASTARNRRALAATP